ncbi:hypothetical protein R3P38DRAFT_3193907 [Favolaschia claudopus]|uniref:Uncharacterized protein n=1 Tax=Favolaschia claudopus TaxID=2862362 RepID=A0AAW0BFB6_9AGAR
MSDAVVLIEAPEAFIDPPVSVYSAVDFVNGAVSSAALYDASAAPSAAGAASSAF